MALDITMTSFLEQLGWKFSYIQYSFVCLSSVSRERELPVTMKTNISWMFNDNDNNWVGPWPSGWGSELVIGGWWVRILTARFLANGLRQATYTQESLFTKQLNWYHLVFDWVGVRQICGLISCTYRAVADYWLAMPWIKCPDICL